jgi:tetratricopeptide (TPR) repeat protein
MIQRFLFLNSVAVVASLGLIAPVLAASNPPTQHRSPAELHLAQGMNDTWQERRERMIQAARQYENAEQWAEAEKAWRDLIQETPNNSTYHFRLGGVLARQKKFDEAIASYQKAIQLEPNYAIAYHALGEVLAEQEKLDDAIAAFRKAISINENYEEPLTSLALVLKKKGQNAEAIPLLERAKAIFQQRGNFRMVREVELLIQQMREPKTS